MTKQRSRWAWGKPTRHPNAYRHHVAASMWLTRDGDEVGAVALCGYTWAADGDNDGKPLCRTCSLIAGLGTRR